MEHGVPATSRVAASHGMLDAMTNHTMAGPRRPIRLGALAPLSRPGFLEAGRHLRAGIELAVAEVNDAGGIGGRPLELQLRDTAGAPDRAEAAVWDFAAEGAVAVVGEYHSVVAHAAAGTAVKAQLPFVCSSAVLDGLVGSPAGIVARVAPAQSYCWHVYADYLASAGHGHVALVVQPDRYWSSGARLLRASLAERGVTVTEIEHARLPDTSVADVIDAIGGADALLLLVGYPEPAVSLVKAVRAEARLSGLLIGDPAGRAEFPEWLALLGEDGADIPFLRYLPSQLGSLGTRVAERLTRIVGESPSFVAFEGYDSVQVVAEALRVGGPDRLRVGEALSSLQVAGTRGTISFSAGSGTVLQWTWPPVQIAARRDPQRPQAISVLRQQAT
jgi:ABC-type branched-subunit amino acid transport system substrate-binding protein